jgi:hypothetical protein
LLGVEVLMPGQRRGRGRPTRFLRNKLSRRNSIEPVIGHLKHDHWMGRCYLKCRLGDRLNALGAALGFNLRKLPAGLRQHPRCAGWTCVLAMWSVSIGRNETGSTTLRLW